MVMEASFELVFGIVVLVFAVTVIFCVGIVEFGAADGEIVFGGKSFVRVVAEPDEDVEDLVGERVCASVDSSFEYFTNGGGIRCTKYVGASGVEVEYVFQPLDNWEGAYVFDTVFVGLNEECYIPSGSC